MKSQHWKLQLYFFGIPQITEQNQQRLKITLPALSLLAFLATAQPKHYSRDYLATLFWPQLAEARAKRNLNNLLWELRTAFKKARVEFSNFLEVDETSLRFQTSSSIWCDVIEFQKCLQNSLRTAPDKVEALIKLFERATKLYTGDFLESHYTNWCLERREELREQYLLMLEKLIVAYTTNNQLQKAIETAHRLVQEDNLREEGHFHLIKLCVKSRQLNDATLHYQNYALLWKKELHSEPSPRMVELSHKINIEQNGLIELISKSTNPDIINLLQSFTHLLALPLSTQNAKTDLDRTELLQQVADYAEKTGQELASKHLPQYAINYLQLATDTISKLPKTSQWMQKEIELRRQCNQIYDLLGDRESQPRNLEQALHLTKLLKKPQLEIEFQIHKAWMLMRKGDYREAGTLLSKSQQLAQYHSNTNWEVLSERLSGIIDDELGFFDKALLHHQQALLLSEKAGLATSTHIDHINLSSALMATGQYMQALTHLKKANQMMNKREGLLLRTTIAGNLGNLWTKLGQLNAAKKFLDQADTLAHQTGDREIECWAGARSAYLYLELKKFDHGLQLSTHYYHVAESLSAPRRQVELADIISALYNEQGNSEQALFWCQKAEQLARKYSFQRYQLRALGQQNRAYIITHNYEAAAQITRRILTLLQARSYHLEEEPEILYWCARTYELLGSPAKANDCLQRVRSLITKFSNAIANRKLRQSYLNKYSHVS